MRVVCLHILFGLFQVVSSFAQDKVYDWLIIYYMPYDNDLSNFKQPILNQFKGLDLKRNICIIFQVDQANNHGLTRHIINSTWDSLQLNEERSASAKVFEDYLEWSANKFKARHYAIILLSHGGLINEYGVDQSPQLIWLGIDSLAMTIKKFNRTIGVSKIDLLFEQACTRGTIENFYEFKDVADYTLASQSLVPLPNYYYTNTFKWLDQGGVYSGKELAAAIIKNERADMYYSYTLINNNRWEKWASLWNEYSEAIQDKNIQFKRDSLLTISYSTDLYFDLESLLSAIRVNDRQPNEGRKLIDFTNSHLRENLYLNPNNNKMVGYSGLSILNPFIKGTAELAFQSTETYISFQNTLKRLKNHPQKK